MAERRKYIVLFAGWIAGRRVEAGDEILLTEAEAEYEHVSPAEDTPPAKEGKRK